MHSMTTTIYLYTCMYSYLVCTSYVCMCLCMYVVCMACTIMSPRCARFLLPPETLHYLLLLCLSRQYILKYIYTVYMSLAPSPPYHNSPVPPIIAGLLRPSIAQSSVCTLGGCPTLQVLLMVSMRHHASYTPETIFQQRLLGQLWQRSSAPLYKPNHPQL